jgi:uncharacterized protein YceK
MKNILISLVVLLSLVGCSSESDTKINSDRVIEFATTLKRDGTDNGMYFLEKDMGLGWNATVLVFGYPDNLSACDLILSTARETSPEVNFRCTLAN